MLSPRHPWRRPTSAYVAIYKPNGTTLQAETAATVDSVNTTLSSAYTAKSVSLPLTSVTGLVPGRSYWVASTQGEERCVVRGYTAASKTATIAEALDWPHPSGATFEGALVTYSASSTLFTSVDWGYRAEWRFVFSDRTEYISQVIHCVAQTVPTFLSPDRMREFKPGLMSDLVQWQASKGTDWETDARVVADCVWQDILERGDRPWRMIDQEQLERSMAARMAYHLAQNNRFPSAWANQPSEYLRTVKQEYAEELSKCLGSITWYDESDDQVCDVGETQVWTGPVFTL